MGRLEGQVALVTGAARGLGAAIAKRFAEEGATVLVNDLNLDAAKQTADAIGGFAFAADVSDSAAVTEMFKHLREVSPRLDILVNNAGISGMEGDNEARQELEKVVQEAMESGVAPAFGGIEETTDEDWNRMLSVHMNGTFYCCREAMTLMKAQGSGSIVNMGSIMGTSAFAGALAYSAAKAGILGFSRALAREGASHAIRVNAIAPGWIATDMTAPLEPMHDLLTAMTPLGRMGEADDIAWAAVYLASAEAKFMTGQVISPNGGWYMSQ